ncbi:MAG TPA: hypothetical protein VIC58_12005, partial [Actinomycetota bacterium]
VTPDGATIAVSGLDGAVELREADTLQPIRTMSADGVLVADIVFDRRGDLLATIDRNGAVRVWDSHTGDLTFTPPSQPVGADTIAFGDDGSLLVVVYEDGRILSYPIALEDAIANARSRVTRSLTDAECRTYLHLEACPAG